MTKLPITSADLRKLPYNDFVEIMGSLTPAQAEEIQYNWEFWARPDQLEPAGDWRVWFNNSGRGAGKTRSGAEWVRHRIKSGDRRVACVAPTKGDVRRVMVEGESGLLNVCWKNDKTYKGTHIGLPVWSPTNNTLTWANGSKAEFFSAEDPERLRGPQFHSAWCDEIAAWRNMQDVWDMLQFTLRLGKHPKVYITTTPKPKKLVRELVKEAQKALETKDPNPRVVLSTVSSYENSDNIDLEAFKSYEGTRLGRQELYAEILEESAGALWSMELIDKAQILELDLPEEFQRIVVAVDPAVTSNEESDMTGIVVAGLDVNGIGYILEDATDQYTPAQWAAKVIELYHKYRADKIVAERNQGGDMVRHTISSEWENAPIRLVHAARGKFARAEPVSALYEQGKVKHVPDLDQLENQMVTWEPLGSVGSPDRLDAMVWAITELMLGGVSKPQLKLKAVSSEELKEAV